MNFLNVFLFLSTVCIQPDAMAAPEDDERQESRIDVRILDNESWWGGFVGLGARMPFDENFQEVDLETMNFNNQSAPLLLSDKGRYVWSDRPFSFRIEDDCIHISSKYEKPVLYRSRKTLRSAYMDASRRFFPPSGGFPDSLFFCRPQYNTWIELTYDQNQEDILKYADNALKNGFPPGIIMIDDTWQQDYGVWEFRADRFPDPKSMVDHLHEAGFKVMLWVCPFVSPDSNEFRKKKKAGYLLKDETGNAKIIHWWNGHSAVYDFSNPDAVMYFKDRLKDIHEKYGIDGFKFDGGDNVYYQDVSCCKNNTIAVDHTAMWARIGLDYPLNEYRASWKMGGQPLVQRLGDKYYSWKAVRLLIPEMTAAGLLGYSYTCPDMIGGGDYKSFIGVNTDSLDQRLIVRSAQIHAMMPMMQFSVAPWRILDKHNLEIVKNAVALHISFSGYIMKYAGIAAETGEPIVRNMEYEFPGEGFEDCVDQYMLGKDYLVAPVTDSTYSRTVRLPEGKWTDDQGKTYNGGQEYEISVPLNRIPYFRREH